MLVDLVLSSMRSNVTSAERILAPDGSDACSDQPPGVELVVAGVPLSVRTILELSETERSLVLWLTSTGLLWRSPILDRVAQRVRPWGHA
jgi:hypothetical protein